ncbi:cytochrome P450 89A2 [Ricinus communis]|uniref:cytochrome P450 89A2 n=1 Tax=Ricinus communis TaxID=3988 RepID=UPI00201AC041|nr:cytochrome P450 89A2 [Ricinus communis]
METWFIILLSLSLCLFLNSLFSLLKPTQKATHKLPPGPFSIPIISSLKWLVKSFSELEPILRSLRAKYGPVITLRIGPRPAIFITTHSLAHEALVQNGAVFADRPPPLAISKIISSNQHNISSAPYGPTWRLLRRNLTSEILHPSRVKSYSQARKWVIEILINRLKNQSETGQYVLVKEHFHYTMFCLLVLMCFGDKLDEEKIKEVQKVQRNLLLSFNRFNILNFWPSLTRILFCKRWEEFYKLQQDKEEVLIPLIRARKNAKLERLSKDKEDNIGKQEFIVSYVDTLLDLQLPNENRKLEEKEIVSLCSEFLDAGTDTTSTALQWIMANLTKYSHIQEKLFMEIKGVMSAEEEEVKEEDLQKMPYLKAVTLEGLRRHPPGHFVLPHAVTHDTVLDGFSIPKDGTVNFMVAEMALDPKVWKDPEAFSPERFLNDDGVEAFDMTGSREIKMMPFGVGRRICPGYGLAMLHLEYFVANLIWNFRWMAVDGEDVDLSEKQEFTVVMKNPLKARISPRTKPREC